MILALFVAVLVIVVLPVALPLLRPAYAEELPADEAEGATVEIDKTLAALSEIEYDHAMNKLSDRDYDELRARYARKAIGLMQEIEVTEGPEGLAPDLSAEDDPEFLAELEDEAEAEAEAEIAAAQADEPAPPRATAPATAKRPRGAAGKPALTFCHHCGAKLLSPSQVYCHSCGLSLEEVDG